MSIVESGPDVDDDEVERTSAESSGRNPEAPDRLHLGFRIDPVVAVLLVVTIGLAVLLPFQLDRRQDAHDNSDAALLKQGTFAANDFVILLTSPSASDAASYVEKLRDRSTGAFGSQLEDFAKKLEQTVQSQDVEASARVLSSGVASFDAEEGTMALAVSVVQTLTNKSSDEEQIRPYRMRITLVRDGGDWLVSDARFVV